MSFVLTRSDKSRHAAADLEFCLVNNLSDAGLKRGERQVRDLLSGLPGSYRVHLRLVSFPSIRRGDAARAHIEAHYLPFRDLLRRRVDGLFVTGCEPCAETLPQEPFWPDMVDLIDWATDNTRAAIWSCLAAHAAVLHLDGVRRHRLLRKCSGLFDINAIGQPPLLAGLPSSLRVPHSRWNALATEDLVATGYKILSQGPAVGVDTFTKSFGSLFVFLQGHPEYDSGALGREYRRDVGRFFAGASDTYPTLPAGYFDAETEAALAAFAGQAQRPSDRSLMAAFPPTVPCETDTRSLGRILTRNVLDQILARKTEHAA